MERDDPDPSLRRNGYSTWVAALFTRIVLPSMALPFKFFIAALASPVLGISTKANPLEPPLFLSKTKLQNCTVPWAANRACSSASVVDRARLRMSSFIIVSFKISRKICKRNIRNQRPKPWHIIHSKAHIIFYKSIFCRIPMHGISIWS